MTVIREGDLQFTFEASAQACKYDEWAFYRNQFQHRCYRDNKAVDLLCHAGDAAWLIEVKDYRQHARTKAIDLADEMAIKVRDTLAGLVAAQNRANVADEKRMARDMLRKKTLRIVCHIEQPAKVSRLRPQAIEIDKLQQKLRSLLKAIDPHPMAVSAHSMPHRLPWSVACSG
ncbi:hypothetical protein EBQ24_06800 [Allofranklinella schreckenbergeri]|uniref:Cysteinyl-tRNA synthetase n=1 Tax=Allofranklinella schreckenbergeri TaxID=1076744 RepID=A0A3M6R2F7_9BURK|nr:hypothetical protein [Allofranklinella schreckenbergeri]RMX09405.1 hypothetical protein EBQ24_06800 [Allofranklinella schreckenbergeri]